tara:strand:- start:968 stop:1351 length:384 start_codon:yes stop_codon:yes gene_type:complete
MNTLNTILKKITPVKTDLASEKVELAIRKPQSILAEANKLDAKMLKAEDKIEKSYLQYKENQKNWINVLQDVKSDSDKLEDDLVKILDAAQDLGVDGRKIDGFSKAADLTTKLQDIANKGKNLYPKI